MKLTLGVWVLVKNKMWDNKTETQRMPAFLRNGAKNSFVGVFQSFLTSKQYERKAFIKGQEQLHVSANFCKEGNFYFFDLYF